MDVFVDRGSKNQVTVAPRHPSLLETHAPHSAARMMFCTTFLSAPSEDQSCDGGGGGGLRGADLGPGSCLSSLHCLVLPQDELTPGPLDSGTRLSACPKEGAQKLASSALLGGGGASLGARHDGCIWDRVRRRRSRSASPSPSTSPKSPFNQSAKGRIGRWCCCWEFFHHYFIFCFLLVCPFIQHKHS